MSKNVNFYGFCMVYLTYDLEFKDIWGKDQRLHGSMSYKPAKQRQVGSHQRQVASLVHKFNCEGKALGQFSFQSFRLIFTSNSSLLSSILKLQ